MSGVKELKAEALRLIQDWQVSHGKACFVVARGKGGDLRGGDAALAELISCELRNDESNSPLKFKTFGEVAKGRGKDARKARKKIKEGVNPDVAY